MDRTKCCATYNTARRGVMDSNTVGLLVIAAAATGFASVVTTRGISSCNAITYRITSQGMTFAITLVIALSLVAFGNRIKLLKPGDVPKRLVCTDSRTLMYALVAALGFSLSGLLYMSALKREGEPAFVAAVMAPMALVFTAMFGILAGDTKPTMQLGIGVLLALSAVIMLTEWKGVMKSLSPEHG